LALRILEREAMLVVAARRIRPEGRNAAAVCDLDGLRVPRAGRAVHFRRHPALDVPAIELGILRFQSQVNALSQQAAMRVALLEFSADPCEAIPAPHGAVIRLAKEVAPAGAFE